MGLTSSALWTSWGWGLWKREGIKHQLAVSLQPAPCLKVISWLYSAGVKVCPCCWKSPPLLILGVQEHIQLLQDGEWEETEEHLSLDFLCTK